MPDPETLERERRFLDVVIVPFVRDAMLWPILAVFVGHLVAGLSFALVFALRERRPVALIAMGLALVLSINGVRLELRVRGRPAALCAILAATWLISAALAAAGHHYRVL